MTATPRLITLAAWLKATYGDAGPCIHTGRRWARECRIYPPAEKHGREYYVHPAARYIDPAHPPGDLLNASSAQRT